jgi:hypothetical protein
VLVVDDDQAVLDGLSFRHEQRRREPFH